MTTKPDIDKDRSDGEARIAAEDWEMVLAEKLFEKTRPFLADIDRLRARTHQ